MSYKGIESSLNIETKMMTPDMEPIHIPFNCYEQNYKEKMSNITWSYWNNLSQYEKMERLKTHGMKNKTHSNETKLKMRKSALSRSNSKPNKSGSIISKTGEIEHFNSINEVCKKLNISRSHLSEVLSEKRKSVSGWKKYVL